jgi:O-antigen ligase
MAAPSAAFRGALPFMSDTRSQAGVALVMALIAAALPSLLAYNLSPSPTFLNQALAFALWAGFVLATVPTAPWRAGLRDAATLQAALALLGAAALWSMTAGALPGSLGWSAVATLAAAAVLVAGGAAAHEGEAGQGERLFAAFCWAWLITGLLNVAVGCIQVFLPDAPDGAWIAHSGYPGRAVGNLRQPNHLSSLLLWACVATIALRELGQLGRKAAVAVLALLVFAVVLTASRTGLVSVLMLALWGLLDRRLARWTRGLLLVAPLLYALSWGLMAQWAALSQHAFGGAARLAETDISSSRFAIWRDTLDLIRMNPWTGVGFGEFNFAWTLTPFPKRPVAFFDHTHNLPLQLAVELGLPLAALVLGLLGWALWQAARRAWQAEGAAGTSQRCALMMVLMIGLHSQLEYPLWYSYFLLPAAWAWGFALRSPAPAGVEAAAARPWRLSPLAGAAALVVVGAALSVLDYWRVVAIFTSADNAPPLAERIASGQRSVFFAHHADYAAVTSGVPQRDPAHAFDRASHYLLDTRLMIAWSRALAQQGRLDEARHLAERLREFRKTDAAEFFEPCADAASAAAAWQCQLPERVPPWREFMRAP